MKPGVTFGKSEHGLIFFDREGQKHGIKFNEMNYKEREQLPVIPISELKDGGYYIGKTYQRGMPIGLWDAHKKHFICIKPPQFGQFSLYEMKHIENDDGFVCFEPVIKIEL